MRTIELSDNKTFKLSQSWLDSIAKKLVLNILQNITKGKLTIEDGGELYQFGVMSPAMPVHAHIKVKHPSAYRLVLLGGTVGSGEAYMLDAWWSSNLVDVIRVFVANMNVIQTMDSKWSRASQMINSLKHRLRANSKANSKRNIAAHYDLGNDFYKTFLDESMMYSSAVFAKGTENLYEASLLKLQKICEQLQLNKSDHLLEIGSGWGGMAIYAAKNYGCKVTTVTLSEEQYAYAVESVKKEGLNHLVEVRIQDYRDISGQFDKIVSIEMIEAVGYQYYGTFFQKCSELLKADGRMLIQSITIADQRFETEKDNVDFIQAYIFPGGCLPSVTTLCKELTAHSDMQLIGLTEIGHHYATTLAIWKDRFFQNIERIKALGYDEVFIKMWDFYLSYCEGGFRERVIGTSQMLIAKPLCRLGEG